MIRGEQETVKLKIEKNRNNFGFFGSTISVFGRFIFVQPNRLNKSNYIFMFNICLVYLMFVISLPLLYKVSLSRCLK